MLRPGQTVPSGNWWSCNQSLDFIQIEYFYLTGSGAPDTHLFRVENGKLHYVHTLTHLLQANFQGRGAPPNQSNGGAPSSQQ